MADVPQQERQRRGLAAFLRDFLHDEAVGGVLLLFVALIALIWANSPAADSYQDFWHHELTVGHGPWAIHEDLIGWINDGVMAVFFFVVGWRSSASSLSASCAVPARRRCPRWPRSVASRYPRCCSC